MRTFLTRSIFPLCCIGLICWLGWFGYHGKRGFLQLEKSRAALAVLETDLAGAEAKRESLVKRVRLLRPERIDPDLLDSRAREMVEFAHPNDRVLFMKTDE